MKARKIGLEEIQLMYQTRLNSVSNMVIDDQRGLNIFFIQFHGFYPTIQVRTKFTVSNRNPKTLLLFQIDDISGNNFGSLFSKVVLWDMFRIDE